MITVEVKGQTGTGKSGIARIIVEALKANNIPVNFAGENEGEQRSLAWEISHGEINRETPVTISEVNVAIVQTPRQSDGKGC